MRKAFFCITLIFSALIISPTSTASTIEHVSETMSTSSQVYVVEPGTILTLLPEDSVTTDKGSDPEPVVIENESAPKKTDGVSRAECKAWFNAEVTADMDYEVMMSAACDAEEFCQTDPEFSAEWCDGLDVDSGAEDLCLTDPQFAAEWCGENGPAEEAPEEPVIEETPTETPTEPAPIEEIVTEE